LNILSLLKTIFRNITHFKLFKIVASFLNYWENRNFLSEQHMKFRNHQSHFEDDQFLKNQLKTRSCKILKNKRKNTSQHECKTLTRKMLINMNFTRFSNKSSNKFDYNQLKRKEEERATYRWICFILIRNQVAESRAIRRQVCFERSWNVEWRPRNNSI